MMHVGFKAERSERPSPLGYEIPDAAIDQHSDEVVVKRPSRVVGPRHRNSDEANHVVDNDTRDCQRQPAVVARERDGSFRPREKRPEIAHRSTQLIIGQQLHSAAQDIAERIVDFAHVGHHIAPDASRHCSSQVGPQRLAMTPAQVGGMLLW